MWKRLGVRTWRRRKFEQAIGSLEGYGGRGRGNLGGAEGRQMENLGGCKVWRKEGLDRVRRNRGEDEVKNKMKDQLPFLRATLIHFI